MRSLGMTSQGIDTVTSGTGDDILAETVEIEHHLHNHEYWWGALAAPDETDAIEANVDRPFVASSGDDTWGTAIPILGTDDVPTHALDTFHDPHVILVVDTEHATPYRLRFIWGTGTSGAAITALQVSEFMFMATAGPFNSGVPVIIHTPRIAVGWKMWAQAWNATDTSEVDFFYGTHGYLV